MKYLLAVDGGGSKTLGVVTDEMGGMLSFCKAGGSNYMDVGREAAATTLRDLIKSVMKEVGLVRVDISCYGIAGADRDKDFKVIR